MKVRVLHGFALNFAVLSIASLVFPVQTFANPSDLAYCTTTRDSYVASTKKRYESQSYKGQGRSEVGLSETGFTGSTSLKLDLARTWDNFDSSQKKEYEHRNCDELLRQKGLVAVAEIRANSEVAIARLQAETQQNASNNNLEGIKDTNAANTTQTVTVSNNNLAATRDTNSANTTQVIIGEGGNLIRKILGSGDQKDTNQTMLAMAKLREQNEAKKLDNERLRLEQEANKQKQEQVQVIQDPNITLLQSWKLTPVTCSSATASISIYGKQYCTNTNDKLRATQYAYNPSTQLVQLVNPGSSQPDDSNLTMLKNMGFTITACNATSISIYVDNRWYCSIPVGAFTAGQYIYNRTIQRLQRAENRRASPSSRPSTRFR
jgi:hypothetical protein